MMALQLFEVPAHPGRIGVTEADLSAGDSVFLLDFSRPLEIRRWFVVPNMWTGFPVAALVPVQHEGEMQGGYIVGVHRTDRYFEDLRLLWRQRYPQKYGQPGAHAEPLKIVADFARHFPAQV